MGSRLTKKIIAEVNESVQNDNNCSKAAKKKIIPKTELKTKMKKKSITENNESTKFVSSSGNYIKPAELKTKQTNDNLNLEKVNNNKETFLSQDRPPNCARNEKEERNCQTSASSSRIHENETRTEINHTNMLLGNLAKE